MKFCLHLILITFLAKVPSIAETIYPSAYWQITTAVLSAPQSDRENATVLGYQSDGALAVLREGTNNLICLADDPAKKGFSVAAYHKSLDPFMERGRALRREGKSGKEVFAIREEEAKSGALKMPEKALLYVLSGKVNEETREIENKHLRYVIYMPFATAESTGFPVKSPGPGGPWLMNAGTHGAHVMITPPKNKNGSIRGHR